VFAAIGTMPALIAPRNAVGKSIESCSATSTRSSGRIPSASSAEPKRSTRRASAP
jgi:hypothetical protein